MGGSRDSVIDLVTSRFPDLCRVHIGVLTRTWNAHPAGSPIIAEDKDLAGAFAIVYLPPKVW